MLQFQPDEVINNRYRIVRELGAGAMGSVYEAIDLAESELRVALKVLPAQADEPDVWAKGEYEALTRLRHPNLARVYNFGRIEGSRDSFLASEFIKGLDLYKATEFIGLDELCELIVQVCRALSYIHAQGYVHFDIKPDNILVTRRKTIGLRDGSKVQWIPEDPYDDDGSGTTETCVKLIDFGLAERITGSFDFAIKGTLNYLAPEIIQGAKPDRRADLYSLGVTLYQIVNRELPIEREAFGHMETGRTMSRQELFALHMKKVPEFLKAIILRLLQERPEDRFPSAKQVIQAINAGSGRRYELETPETQACYLYASKLVGRARELGKLKELFRSTFPREPGRDGEAGASPRALPALVLVSGEIGSGKSRLVEEFEHFARLENVQVFIGNAYESGNRAYGPLREILRPLVLALGLESDLCRRFGPAIAKILPEFGEPDAGRRGAPGADKEKLGFIDRIARFLVEAGRCAPYIAVLNNLHWADEVSVELVSYWTELLSEALAGPREGRPRILAVATCRTDESISEGLRSLLDGLRDAGHLEEIPLRRLKRSQLKELLGALLGMTEVPARFVDGLEEKTGGNPLYVIETLKALQEEGIIRHTNMGWQIAAGADVGRIDIPTTIESLVLRRFRNLEPVARAILETMAVFHQPMPPGLLARCPRFDEVPVLVVLRDLEEKGLIQKGYEGGGLACAFAQPKFREIVYRHMDAERRAELHGEITALLEAAYEGREAAILEDLAYHACRSADRERALRYARAAGDRLREIHASEKAFEHFRFIADAVAGDPERFGLWAEAQEALGELAVATGRYEEADARFAELLAGAVHRRLAPDDGARAWRWRGRIAEIQGDYEGALRAYREARNILDAAPETSSAERILTCNAIAWLYVCLGRYDKAMGIAVDALHLVEGTDERPEHAVIFSTIARAHSDQGHLPQAMEFYRRSLEIREALGAMAETMGPLNGLASAHREAGAYGDALALYETARVRSEEIGDPYGRALTLHEEAWLWLAVGDPVRADGLAASSLRLSKAHRMRNLTARNHELRGAILRERGEHAAAESHLIRALAAYSKQGNRRAVAAVMLRVAEIHRARGEWAEARKAAEEADRHARELSIGPLRVRARLVLGRVARDDPDRPDEEALVAFEEGLALGAECHSPEIVAEVFHEMAETLVRLRRLDAARELYARAEEKLREVIDRLPDEIRPIYLERHAAAIRISEPPPEEVREEEDEEGEIAGREAARLRLLERENAVLRGIVAFAAKAGAGPLGPAEGLRAAVEATGAERGYLLQVGAGSEDVYVRAAVGGDGEAIRRPSQLISTDVVAEVLDSGRALVVGRAIDDARMSRYEGLQARGLHSLAVVPFRHGGAVRGLLYLENPERVARLSAGHLPLVCDALAALAGGAAREPERPG